MNIRGAVLLLVLVLLVNEIVAKFYRHKSKGEKPSSYGGKKNKGYKGWMTNLGRWNYKGGSKAGSLSGVKGKYGGYGTQVGSSYGGHGGGEDHYGGHGGGVDHYGGQGGGVSYGGHGWEGKSSYKGYGGKGKAGYGGRGGRKGSYTGYGGTGGGSYEAHGGTKVGSYGGGGSYSGPIVMYKKKLQ